MADDSAFDPVVLDVAHQTDFYVLVEALEKFADTAEGRADDERETFARNDLPAYRSHESDLRDQAARARRMLDEVDRQIDANAAAQRREPGSP